MSVKILLLDIETAPAKVFAWGLFDQNIGTNQIVDDGYVLCWCAKWLDEKEVMSDALIDHPDHFKRHPRSDQRIAKSIWKLLGQADIVVTHNGNDFDLKWLNTVFIKHRMKPQTGFKSVDTLMEVRRKFRFISNKLDFVCKKLSLGHKISTGGFELWDECMRGVKESWQKMIAYCKHDVLLLEKLYLEIRPFMTNHPNLALYEDGTALRCPNCSSTNYHSHGYQYTATAKYKRLRCNVCGKKFSNHTKKVFSIQTRGA